MAEQVKKYRDPVFDMMKGIGILLVLWGHAPGISSLTDTFISSFHMPLFFILSGYFCQTSCWPLNILAAVGGVWCLYLLCRKIHKVCEYKYFRFTQSILLWLGVCSLVIMCLHDVELNCSFIRIPMHRLPMVETYCGTLVRYIITIALVWFLSKWSWFRKIFIG